MSIIDSRKKEIETLIIEKKIVPVATQGLDLCFETLKTAKCIYQELFGEELNANSPDYILQIYNHLINSEAEIAIRNVTSQIKSRKQEEANDLEFGNFYKSRKPIAS